MKRLTVNEVIELVRAKIDEIGWNESVMVDTDNDDKDLDTIIRSCIMDAYRFIIINADVSLLEGKQYNNEMTCFSIDDNLIGHLVLPDDFFRGITARLSSWQSSSDEIINENTSEYRMQSDPYACGTFQHPVVALIHTRRGRELEFYKAKTIQDKLESFIYVPVLNLTMPQLNIDIPDQLSEAFIYYVAGLTLTAFRDELSASLFSIAKQLMGIE